MVNSSYTKMLRFNRILFLWIVVVWPSISWGQDFVLEYQNLDDSTLWFVKNNTSKPLKPTSVTLNWYHMKPYFVAWNNDPSQQFYNSTNRETSVGFKYTWKYKTTYGCSVGDTIQPGSRIQVAMTVNYDENNSDTVMPANVTLFVNKANGFEELEVIPMGSTCSFKRIYLNSYHKEQGISFFSTVWKPITSGNCVDGLGLLMVPFNGFTLKPMPSSIYPSCANGRLWTSYGYPIDSQLYYDGYETDTSYWKQVIKGLDPGDYLAFASHVTVSKGFIQNLKAEFESIGVDVDGLLSQWSSSTAQLLVLGRKGVGKGKAGMVFSEMKPNSSARSVVGNFVMIKNQPIDEMKLYPKCYESLSVVHKPYVPDTSHLSVSQYKIITKFYPNPVEAFCNVSSNVLIKGYQLSALSGRLLQRLEFTHASRNFEINMSELSSGLYTVTVIGADGSSRSTQIISKR